MSPSFSQKKGEFITMDDDDYDVQDLTDNKSPETINNRSMKSIGSFVPNVNVIKKKLSKA